MLPLSIVRRPRPTSMWNKGQLVQSTTTVKLTALVVTRTVTHTYTQTPLSTFSRKYKNILQPVDEKGHQNTAAAAAAGHCMWWTPVIRVALVSKWFGQRLETGTWLERKGARETETRETHSGHCSTVWMERTRGPGGHRQRTLQLVGQAE